MQPTDLLEYLPDVFKVKEMMAHVSAENPEMELVWARINDVEADQYLYTMTENGVKRWEKLLSIEPNGTESIDDRRFKIINRLNSKLPYTYKMLESHLIQMCGADGFVMSYNPDTFTLMIKVAIKKRNQYDEVLRLVQSMIPMNLILDYGILYNSYKILSAYTHAELAANTHYYLRNEILA